MSTALERVSFLPMLVPSIAFGAIYLSLYSVPRGPIPALYGSMAILVLIIVGKQLPFTAQGGIASMHQIAGELEEAGKIAGASWMRRFKDIMWPLTIGGFFSGFLIVFITTMRELSLFVLLSTPRTQLLTTLTFEYAEIASRQLSNALMTLLIVIVVLVSGIVKIVENWASNRKRT